MNKHHFHKVIFLTCFALAGCGTKVGTGLTGDVTLGNAAFSTSTFAAVFRPALLRGSVSSFKLCVTKVKLQKEDDSLVESEGSNEIEFNAGLVDLSSGAASNWATAPVPVAVTVDRLKVEVHHDPEKCDGAGYSVKYDSIEVTEDVEFKFRFASPVTITAGDSLQVSLDTIVNTLISAADSSSLTDENIKEYIEQHEETATKSDD